MTIQSLVNVAENLKSVEEKRKIHDMPELMNKRYVNNDAFK